MVKARLADNVNDAFYSVKGLVATNHLPYLSFESEEENLSRGTITLKDWTGALETFNLEMEALDLVSVDMNHRMSILDNAKLDK